MRSAIPVQTVLALNKGGYLRETKDLSRGQGKVYATKNLRIGSTGIPHFHDDTQVSLIVKGAILDRRNKSAEEQCAGALMFFHAGEPHQSIYQLFPTVNVTLELTASYLSENFTDESILQTRLSASCGAKIVMLKIYQELLLNDGLSACSIDALVLNLLAKTSRPKRGQPRWVTSLAELLNDRWNEELSLADMSAAIGVHPITISKHFPRYFACTVGEYRRRQKVEKALALIKSSTCSLTEISHQCGFSDQSHFTRTFRQMTGFLPKDYRVL